MHVRLFYQVATDVPISESTLQNLTRGFEAKGGGCGGRFSRAKSDGCDGFGTLELSTKVEGVILSTIFKLRRHGKV